MRVDLPTGTVTLLFTDIEGSTRLLQELGAGGYADALAEHRRVLREAFERHGGVEVDTQGDAFLVAFSTGPGALDAARAAQAGHSPRKRAPEREIFSPALGGVIVDRNPRDRDKVALLMLFRLGIRKGELRGFRLEHYDAERQVIKLRGKAALGARPVRR